MSPIPGWYADPSGDASLIRYWDGEQWGADAYPATAPEPEAAAPPPAAPAPPAPAPVPAFEPAAPAPAPAFEPAPPAPAPAFEPEVSAPAPAFEPEAPAPAPAPVFEPEAPAPAPAPAPSAPAAPSAPSAPGAPAPSGGQGSDSLAGITTDLLSDSKYSEKDSGERVTLQNAKLLKVELGEPVLAKQGAMVAFQGSVDFSYEGSGGLGKMMKKAMSGEGVSLMRCTGQGELFLANNAEDVHILHLDGGALSISGSNILAFEPTLTWDIERIKGAGMLSGGLFNTRISGTGWVAITSKGTPVVLHTDQPTFADPDAVIAWSANLTTSMNRTAKAGALVGRGSGEAFQLAFHGNGIVIVQPAEAAVPHHTHAN